MSTLFAQDLRLARRKAGLTQRDCAHLLGINRARMNELERGKRLPTLLQLYLLSLIYDRNFESLFIQLAQKWRGEITTRLRTLPKIKRGTVVTYHRKTSLEKLTRRLAASPQHYDIA